MFYKRRLVFFHVIDCQTTYEILSTLSVHNACSCLPLTFQPAAQKLLSKTICIDKEPNNNVKGKKSPPTDQSKQSKLPKDQSESRKDDKKVPSNNNDLPGAVAREPVAKERRESGKSSG